MSNLSIRRCFPLILLLTVLFVSLNFSSASFADQGVKNVETFSRLYGYVRYFYPGDEAAGTDWDRFTVYGVKRVEKAGSSGELKDVLEELFLPIAPALVIRHTNEKAAFSMAGITPPDPKGMKVVAWQHYGVGTTSSWSIYRSIRLNRENKIPFKDSFGTIILSIDAEPYRGKEIKLKAAVKVEEGAAQMWVRVDRKGRKTGFFDNMDDRPIRSGQWQDYEIKGSVADDAEKISYGCLLRAEGKVWTDDFRLYVKESESDQWEPVTIKNPGFEADKENLSPKEWSTRSLGYTVTVTSETAAKGSKSVLIKSKTEGIKVPLFDKKPGIGEFIAKDLGSGLSCIMPIALYGTEKHTFPRAPETALSQLKTAVERDVPKNLSAGDLYVRLADIAIAWNVFQHFFPYFEEVKTDWKASLTEALASAYNDKTPRDFLKTLQKFTAGLKDGHLSVFLMGDAGDSYYIPLKWEWIEKQLVITEIFDKNITGLRIGDIVTEVDGVPAEEALEEKERYISAATGERRRYRALHTLLTGPEDSETILKIKRDGKVYSAAVPRSADARRYYSLSRTGEDKSGKIEEGIYYLNLDMIPMDKIDRLMPELEKAKSIICDLRGYPKSNHQLISHLLKEEDTSKWMFVPQVIYPDYEKVTYGESGWHMKPLKPALTAKVIFITDVRAISYAESYMGYVEHYKLATIIGRPTAGTNGNATFFYLPGGYRISWTGMKVLKHDGSPLHGVGIIPHILLERTVKGVKEGRDEFLEKAIELAEK